MSHMKRLLDSHPHVECEVMSESQKITINTLNDQNQELLEALELYNEFSKANDDRRDDAPDFVIKAREAIAKARGEVTNG